MSGPYDQQLFAQNTVSFGGQVLDTTGVQLAGQVLDTTGVQLTGQALDSTGGQFAGQYGGQVLDSTGGQFSGQYGGQVAYSTGGQAAYPAAGQVAGVVSVQYGAPTVVQTTSQYSSQAVRQTGGQLGGQSGGQTVVTQGSSSRGERQRRQRNASSSSSSAADNEYKVSGGVGGVGVSSGYQQYSAESNYATGGATGASYGVSADTAPTVVVGQRRQGRHRKQVIRLPDQPQAPARQVRRRLLTPEPDTIERVYIQRTGAEVVEEITEIPTTPPPRLQERTVVEPAGPPQVIKRVVRVPPRGGYASYQQQGTGFVSNVGQGSGNLLSSGSYGNVQPTYGGYQQYSGLTSTTGYGSYGGGYGSFGGGLQQGGSYGSLGGGLQQGGGYGGYTSQAAAPSYGIPGANCFYV
jgi:hypothetical protein